MNNVDTRIIEDQISAFVAAHTGLASAAELSPSSGLFSSGLLDSMAFLELVMFAEERFQIRLSDGAEVTMQALDTVGDLANAVRTAQAQRSH